jgi:hypothetical protein
MAPPIIAQANATRAWAKGATSNSSAMTTFRSTLPLPSDPAGKSTPLRAAPLLR